MTCKHGQNGPEWCDLCDPPARCAHGRLWPVAACAFCDAALVARQRERLGGPPTDFRTTVDGLVEAMDKLRRREVELLQEIKDRAAERDAERVTVNEWLAQLHDARKELERSEGRRLAALRQERWLCAEAVRALAEKDAIIACLTQEVDAAEAETRRASEVANAEIRRLTAHIARMEADARTAKERVERITWEAQGAPMKGETP